MNHKELYNRIIENLKNKTCLSLIRLGDGESMVIQYPYKPHKMEYVMKRQFNYLPSVDDMNYISKLVTYAYSDCDIIGVPTDKHRELHGYWWASAQDKLYEKNPVTRYKETTSIDAHTDMMHAGLLDKLLNSVDEVFYVSGRDITAGLESKYKLKANAFIIPAEQKFDKIKSQVRHYPEKFKEVREWIKTQHCKGKLCLVGAGVLGKVYTSLFKEQGGIALDIGHIFDMWYGKRTRGAGKGVDSVDNTYKL